MPPSNGEGAGEVAGSYERSMEVVGRCGNQFRAIMAVIRRTGNLLSASEVLPNATDVIELTGVPGGIRTLVCAVKAICPDVSY
jgi:hypothetical protein